MSSTLSEKHTRIFKEEDMSDKYAIVILCNDGDGEIEFDYVDMLFDNREIAEKEMEKIIKKRVKSLNENGSYRNCYYEYHTIYANDYEFEKYQLMCLTKEYKKNTVCENNKFSRLFPDVSPELYSTALDKFRSFFEIDEENEEYACGDLEKLSIIIGKDYKTSDLIYQIADNFVNSPDFGWTKGRIVWENSIIKVIGEKKCEIALNERYPNPYDIYSIIECFWEELCIYDNDLKVIKENKELTSKIYFNIAKYLDYKNLDWEDIDTSKHLTDKALKTILRKIKNIYKEFKETNKEI
jgi:hypothetical protein